MASLRRPSDKRVAPLSEGKPSRNLASQQLVGLVGRVLPLSLPGGQRATAPLANHQHWYATGVTNGEPGNLSSGDRKVYLFSSPKYNGEEPLPVRSAMDPMRLGPAADRIRYYILILARRPERDITLSIVSTSSVKQSLPFCILEFQTFVLKVSYIASGLDINIVPSSWRQQKSPPGQSRWHPGQ